MIGEYEFFPIESKRQTDAVVKSSKATIFKF